MRGELGVAGEIRELFDFGRQDCGLGDDLVALGGGAARTCEHARAGGVEKLLTLGAYLDVSVRRAREKRDDARRALADGIDPGAKRRAESDAKTNTFSAVADEWLLTKKASLTEPYVFVRPGELRAAGSCRMVMNLCGGFRLSG